ncbi:hypothetical protein KHC23_11410 [Ancylobacter dichloromethanicus]|uniref:Uncharacterized protein n=1 Tax=Ancylobacter dichloromethanicus TaxID=518825 RepID=A0A9W6MYW6_9HYPH|nr:hypothetical protein [Ancylobacter dichloromethanicus]MBS7554258.1 hypothetical protein [Ancylobacter dichloromethanicus]GLK71382.1 hypothetical protein GCM10017643_14970 [Ancylobacter dichloromethanicus]
MPKRAPETLFKPKLSQSESKAESVSRIAMSMIEQESTLREAKIARLREARLAQEAAERAVAKPPPKATRRTVKR